MHSIINAFEKMRIFPVTLCMLGNFYDFVSRLITLKKKSFRNTTRVSNSLDPDQARRFVGPDLGLNYCKCYQQTSKVAAS